MSNRALTLALLSLPQNILTPLAIGTRRGRCTCVSAISFRPKPGQGVYMNVFVRYGELKPQANSGLHKVYPLAGTHARLRRNWYSSTSRVSAFQSCPRISILPRQIPERHTPLSFGVQNVEQFLHGHLLAKQPRTRDAVSARK